MNKDFALALAATGDERLERRYINLDKYEGAEVTFKLVRKKKHGDGDLALITKLMADAGFVLTIEKDNLTIGVDAENLSKVKHSYAGRSKKKTDYKLSDIVAMMQTMTDKEISEKLNMPIATYYRHKKKLKDSIYYRSLDKSQLNDRTYLESVRGNVAF